MNKDYKIINNIRVMASEVIANAKSGHTGIVLSSAPILYTLFAKHLQSSPFDSTNILRDRFVMSAGHGSALLYTILHCFGYNVSIQDLKMFRKLGSKTSGHPELDPKIGVECTTGPLGQGVATAVGMALANKKLENFNKEDCKLFDNKIYALVGDGCLMEGVSYEALSLAGTLKLNNLIVLYDSNNNTLDSDTKNTFNIDTSGYFKSIGFDYILVKDGNNVKSIDKAISRAKKSNKPVLIEFKTKLGYASHLEDSFLAHGLVMDLQKINDLRVKLGIKSKPLELEAEIAQELSKIKAKNNYNKIFADRLSYYKNHYPNDYEDLTRLIDGKMISLKMNDVKLEKTDESTRNIGALVINELCKKNKSIVGGNADLSSCTKAYIKEGGNIEANNFAGRNIFYGIREFGMSCMANGLALMGYKTFAGTFMVFSDYMRSAIRSSAIMGLPVTYILSHDSIAVGEDGPTHQPIEHIDSYRAMPNLNVFRPCNLEETIASYNMAFCSISTPSIISLTRQPIKLYKTNNEELINIKKGAYIFDKETAKLTSIIIATGSEVSLAMQVKQKLGAKGKSIRIVSMPCEEIFDKQSIKYKEMVLPKEVEKRFILEASAGVSLQKYLGAKGKQININNYGLSAPMNDVFNHFGFSVEDVILSLK